MKQDLKGPLVAAIDIGSNTIQMLAGKVKEGRVIPVCRFLATTRLGHKPGELQDSSIQKSLEAFGDIKAILDKQGVEKVKLVATSALRDAANQNELLVPVREQWGWEITIAEGAEEAFLAYSGAVSVLPEGEYAVIDIGGGSTEVITRACAYQSLSYDIGAVRALNNNWSRDDILREFSSRPLPEIGGKALVGAGGTITTAAALKAGLLKYDAQAVQGIILERLEIIALRDELSNLTLKERCFYSPLLEKRGEIILEGLTILEVLLELLDREQLIVSDAGILEGIILNS